MKSEAVKSESIKQLAQFILFDRIWVRLSIVILAFLATVAGILVPYYQRSFSTQFDYVSLALCTAMALSSFLLLQITNYLGQIESLHVQKKLSQKLYQHILSLKPLSTSNKTVGEMVALYTTDIPSCTMWLEQTIPYALTTAFPLILAPLFLKFVYAIPFTLTLSLIFSIIGINLFLARRQSIFFSQFKILAAQRMGLVNEWIQNIRGLKSLNWVSSFENKIIFKRIEETNNRIAMVTNGQIMNSISSSITFWLNLSVIVFVCYLHTELISKIDIIAIMWVLGVFLAKPLRQLPWFFTMMFDAWTSIKRIGDFFSITNKEHIILNKHKTLSPENVLEIEDLNLRLEHQYILKNINLTIRKNEVVALIGPVGSGKSILIKSIMRETPFVAKSIANEPYCYLPQEPFILSASLTENIVFDYDEKNINEEKALTSLKQAQFDLAQDRLSDGLQTLIGERGLNISGGQKQRLNIARLFYHPQPLFLLDDPFSAVDVGTEHKLIQVIKEYKHQGASFLVVTQRYDFLPHCDRILFIDEGKIEYAGTYEEFVAIDKYRKFIDGEA